MDDKVETRSIIAVPMDIAGKMFAKKEKKDLLLIHGAWSTNTTFNYLLERLKSCKTLGNVLYADYDTHTHSVSDVVAHGTRLLEKATNPVVVVGHSMGGIAALNFHDHPKVESIVTVASPIDGLSLNRFLQMFLTYRSPTLSDILHMSSYLLDTHDIKYTKPITCIVTTRGYNPAWYEKSDGVVPVSSQKRWVPDTARIHEVPYNHHEVLQSPEFFEVVKEKM